MKNKIYYIYHIPGKKIGVSQNVKVRIEKQGYTIEEIEVLEEHTDIHTASLREQELQKEYGYPVDKHPYWKTIQMATLESISKGGKITGMIQGPRNVESGLLKRLSDAQRTPILQYTKTGEFIKEFVSQAEAARELNLFATSITAVCKGKLKTCGGFVFRYVNELAC